MSLPSMRFKRGQIWHIREGDYVATKGIQSGSRPYLIISSDIGNRCNDFVTALACTGKTEKAGLGINVLYYSEYSNRESLVLGNQIRNIPKDVLNRNGQYMETLTDEIMEKVNRAVMTAMEIPCNESKPVDLTALKNLVAEITNARVSEIKNDKRLTEDMVLDIASGLENIFSDVLSDYRKTQEVDSSFEDIGLGLIKMQNALDKKKVGSVSSASSSSENSDTVSDVAITSTSDKGVVGGTDERAVKGSDKKSFRKPNGYWTDDKMKEYIEDKHKMKLSELVAKWDVESSDAAMRLYYACRKKLHKKGIDF
jgi:mRNA-degrading endonuclease toxin of MazEF toxin-antitoxin module